jgi:hypothetical protein
VLAVFSFVHSQDSDLRSALLLEQAAHCFINMKSPMVRKYAFHMILAGHRFSKAGQVSTLSLKGCYIRKDTQQLRAVPENPSWDPSTHIEFFTSACSSQLQGSDTLSWTTRVPALAWEHKPTCVYIITSKTKSFLNVFFCFHFHHLFVYSSFFF